MAVVIEDIGSESCEPVAGFTPKVYWAEHSDFVTINDPKDICDESGTPAATLEELVEITANHVMKSGKKLHLVDFDTETGSMTYPTMGEKNRRLYDNSMVFECSGSSAKLLGFARLIRNKKVVFFMEEFGSGNMRQIGSSRLPGWVETQEGAIEALIEGKNSIIFTVKDKQKWPAPIYKGTLQLTPVTP